MPNNNSILPDPAREAAAIGWLLNLRDPQFTDWDGFAIWLESDPQNNAAYESMAVLDAGLDDLPRSAASPDSGTPSIPLPAPWPTAANDDDGVSFPAQAFPSRLHRRWFGGAIAAALIAAIALPSLNGWLSNDVRRIQTLAGQSETITLADGSRIDINGGSVLELDDQRPRFARLSTGEAMFHIVHRKDAPFVVESGGARIVDLGTAFNVVRSDTHTSVAVSEGLVVFNPDSDNVQMRAGQGVNAADDRTSRPRAKPVDVAAVGGWRSGLLVYNGAPLSEVVADLHRTTGMEISVSVDAADLPFRGALTIDPDGQRTVDDLAALSGTRVLRQGRGWMLSR